MKKGQALLANTEEQGRETELGKRELLNGRTLRRGGRIPYKRMRHFQLKLGKYYRSEEITGNQKTKESETVCN